MLKGSVMCLCCVCLCVLVFDAVCRRHCRRCVVGCVSVVVDPLAAVSRAKTTSHVCGGSKKKKNDICNRT